MRHQNRGNGYHKQHLQDPPSNYTVFRLTILALTVKGSPVYPAALSYQWGAFRRIGIPFLVLMSFVASLCTAIPYATDIRISCFPYRFAPRANYFFKISNGNPK
jgi:hypothetical protein